MPARIEWTNADRSQFETLCSIFCTRDEVAQVMGVTVPTLKRLIAENYPETPTWESAFDLYSARGKVSLRRKQYQMALEGDRTMLIWLGKNHLGQSDTPKAETQAPAESKLVKFRDVSKARKNA